MRQIVLDTETTGLSAQTGDRILEIGCVEIMDRRLSGNDKHFYINPERDSHEDALRVHGITTEFLKDKPLFKDIAQELIQYLQGAELIIHNAPFDVGFLNKEFERLGLPLLEDLGLTVTDTLSMARELFPGKRNSLDALCERLEIDNTQRVLHGALLDAQLLADVYISMTRGQHNLLMDENALHPGSPHRSQTHTDLSTLSLPIIEPTDKEQQAHETILAEIAKASAKEITWGLATKLPIVQ